MSALPETVLQFGAGRFLRAFADLFIDQANRQGQAVCRVVVVQSTGDERARARTSSHCCPATSARLTLSTVSTRSTTAPSTRPRTMT